MISFGLRLSRFLTQPSLSALIGAHVYAALLVAGPWIFTVLGLVGLGHGECTDRCELARATFRSIIIYNSFLSLLVVSPIAFVYCRHIADEYHFGRTRNCNPLFFLGVAAFSIVCLIVAVPFYGLATTLTPIEKFASVQNALLVGMSWLLVPFIGAVRGDNLILVAFAVATVILWVAGSLMPEAGTLSLLLAFNAGFAVVDTILIGVLISTFGTRVRATPKLAINMWRKDWMLGLAGFAYAFGILVDKVVMWFFAEQGQLVVAGSLRTLPAYDTSMFWAQLVSIPVLALFYILLETRVVVLVRRLQSRLADRASLQELNTIADLVGNIVRKTVASMFVVLVVVAVVMILLSLVFMKELGLRPAYMSIMRASMVATVFHTTAMLCFAFLLNMDLRRSALLIVATHAVLNTALTFVLLDAGPPFYGYSNMIASALTAALAFWLLSRELGWLTYHALVTNNSALRIPSSGATAATP